jgi:acetylornithine/succinyldiaminopimelate/putrescine aminotransferase
VFSLLVALVAAVATWILVTDEDGFGREGGSLALFTVYVFAIIFTIGHALVSGVFAFGSFLAVRLIVRKTHNNKIHRRNA